MNNSVATLRLQDAWRECERNAYHLLRACNLLKPLLPMTGGQFERLTDEQIRTLDQFVLRFTKLQDAMGGRLFPAILGYLQEPYETQPMLDKLNRLEKLGYLQNAETWQDIRTIRNKFAHDYPDDSDKNAALINLATESAQTMRLMLSLIENKLKQTQAAVDLGATLAAHEQDKA